MKRNNLYFGLPGQREVVRSDERTEYRLVLKQWSALVVAAVCVFLLAYVNVLIIGPWLGYVGGLFIIISLGVWLWRLLEYTQAATLVLVAGAIASGLWLAFGFDFIVTPLWWNVRVDWPVRFKAAFVVLSGIISAVTYLVVYRFSYEIIDRNWPPPVAVRPAEWGVMWPGFTGEPEEESELPQVKSVPRPVPSDGALNVKPESVPDANKAENTKHKTVVAPSGREVLVSDLVTFARLAPKIGASFRTWGARAWSNQQWADVIDTWAVFGVCSERKPKKTTKILVKDSNEALGRLSEVL